MTKTTAELIKEIRTSNELTQKAFAKRFFITEKAISNYETGKRTPDFDFIIKLCNEFNLSLDFFLNRKEKESLPQDLIVSSKNGKFGIFDTRQSFYLTQHIYDGVMLSDCGNHIVYKGKKIYNEKGEHVSTNITYSAIVDNCGNVKEFSDLEFGFNGKFINGVCPAYNKKTKKVHLVNNKGEILSEGFTRIAPVGYDKNIFGLYYGLVYNDKKDKKGELKLKERKLIFKNGEEIKVKFNDINACFGDLYVKEFEDISVVREYIFKYGANILDLLPEKIFKVNDNYFKLLLSVSDNCFYNKDYAAQILYATKLLTAKAELYKPHKEFKGVRRKINFEKECVEPITSQFHLFGLNLLERNIIEKYILNLEDLLSKY